MKRLSRDQKQSQIVAEERQQTLYIRPVDVDVVCCNTCRRPTGWHVKRKPLYFITSSYIDRFSKFFQWLTLRYIFILNLTTKNLVDVFSDHSVEAMSHKSSVMLISQRVCSRRSLLVIGCRHIAYRSVVVLTEFIVCLKCVRRFISLSVYPQTPTCQKY